jgi:hypothetical protein
MLAILEGYFGSVLDVAESLSGEYSLEILHRVIL